ncbi:uncharacterized protein LOC122619868 [Drosophila teissieri]|uniref:uncharacterized protein LOC122619868 n=1 Tax=Drosophila teissieri TaxID=7243 RepID=UPI001CBA0AF1|nr:uncharacterized protein LOC122619868 [Drosophila teissieri]
MAQLLNRLKRRTDDDSSIDFGPSPKRSRDKHLNKDSRSSYTIPRLKDDETKGSLKSGYFPELGPKENPYYLQNQLLFNLHVEREKRREINSNFLRSNYINF